MGGLEINRTNVSEFRGCHSTFGEYAESLHKSGISVAEDPVVVKPIAPVLYHLFNEAQLIIHMVNASIFPFLRIFQSSCTMYCHFLGALVLSRILGQHWRNSSQKQNYRMSVTFFLAVIPTMEATLAVTVIVRVMKSKVMTELRVKVIPNVNYLLIVFNKWCAL